MPRTLNVARVRYGKPRARRNFDDAERVAEDALISFQSRVPRGRFTAPVDLPAMLYSCGEPVHVMYHSDKDDPETRTPDRRANDPAGKQGVWKDFIHKHTPHRGLRLYDGSVAHKRFLPLARAGFMPDTTLDVQWPSGVLWLGNMIEVLFNDNSGASVTYKPRGWDVWAFPSTKALLALPDPRQGPITDFLLWFGGDLHVTYRGIQG